MDKEQNKVSCPLMGIYRICEDFKIVFGHNNILRRRFASGSDD